jgi:hypothetical protein
MINDIETEIQNFAGELIVQIQSGYTEEYVVKLLNSWNKEYFAAEPLKIIDEPGIYQGDREVLKSLESVFFAD